MDEAAFLEAIRASPADDTLRLVYADWLEDRGEPKRAELIRLQCRIASGAPYSMEEDDRVYDLIDQHRHEWTAHLPQSGGAIWEFRRGLPEELTIDLPALLDEWPQWLRIRGIRCLTLFATTCVDLMRFANRNWNPEWTMLQSCPEPRPWMHMYPSDWSPAIQAIVLSPQAAQLRELRFNWDHALGEGGVAALCESPHLEDLLVLAVHASYLEEPRLVARFGERLVDNSK